MKSRPVEEKEGTQIRAYSHSEKRPKHPFGVLFFSLW
jgi:hypothetical protein